MSAATTATRPAEDTTVSPPPTTSYDHETRQILYITSFFTAVGLLVASLALGLSARRHPAALVLSAAQTRGHEVFVAEHDYALDPNATVLAAGPATIRIANFGPSSHELLAFRTDLPEAGLPTGDDGRVNEDDPSITKVLDTDTDLTPSTERTIAVNLTPGRYVFICNLVNHYRLGMHYVVTVTS